MADMLIDHFYCWAKDLSQQSQYFSEPPGRHPKTEVTKMCRCFYRTTARAIDLPVDVTLMSVNVLHVKCG